MSIDAFLKVTGVDGESKAKGHEKWIQLQSYSFGGSNIGSAALGGGMGTGKADLQDFHFTTSMDKSVPDLMAKCLTGEHIPKAELHQVKSGGTNLTFFKVTMEEVLISSVQFAGSGDIPNCSVSFNFTKIKTEYTAQNAQGGSDGTSTQGYDIKQNVKV